MPSLAARPVLLAAAVLSVGACRAQASPPTAGSACGASLEQRCQDDTHVLVCRAGVWQSEASFDARGCVPGELVGGCGAGSGGHGCPCSTRGWFSCGAFCSGTRWEYGPNPACADTGLRDAGVVDAPVDASPDDGGSVPPLDGS